MGVEVAAPAATGRARWAEFVFAAALWILGLIAAVTAVAIVFELFAFGRIHIAHSFSPSGDDIGLSIAESALFVLAALPLAAAIALGAAMCADDAAVGGRGTTAVRLGLEAFSGMPASAVGVAVVLVAVFVGVRLGFATGAAALIALHLPTLTAGLTRALGAVPKERRIAAAAAGAPPVRVLTSVVVPAAASRLIAVILSLGAQMYGETAVLAIATRSALGLAWLPLPLRIWVHATDATTAPHVAAQCLILLGPILVLVLAARAVARPKAKTWVQQR